MKIVNLVKRVQNADEVAFKEIIDIHHCLICKIISNYQLDIGDYRCNFEDLYQEAIIALHEACLKFQPEKNVKFSSYAFVLIRARVVNCIRNDYKHYYGYQYSIDNLDSVDYLKDLNVTSVYEDPIKYNHSIDNQNILKKFFNNLKENDSTIVEMRMNDVPYKEIAKKLEVSVKYVDNRFSKIKGQLKKYIEENDLEY